MKSEGKKPGKKTKKKKKELFEKIKNDQNVLESAIIIVNIISHTLLT